MSTAEPLDGITRVQRDILQAIRRLTHECRRPPSMREVLEGIGLQSPGSLSYQYRALRAKGYLRWEDGRPRTAEVRMPGEPPFPPATREPGVPPRDIGPQAAQVPGLDKVVWVPVAGEIAAGRPIRAEQVIEDHLPLPREMVGREEGLFILKVTGDSMIGVGIFPGDMVVIRPLFQPPQNGDIVAATIDGVELEGTVKTYVKDGRHIWLMPQNPAYTPIPGGKAKIAGKVVAVLRQV